MSMELGIRINTPGSGQKGQEHAGNSRRQQHQQKLKALIAALDAADLVDAKAKYHLLLEFSPGLEATNFGRVGQALGTGQSDVGQAGYSRNLRAEPSHIQTIIQDDVSAGIRA